jgi:hypothetical protein
MSMMREDTMQSSLHDIVTGLMLARMHATLMAEQWPHHSQTLTTFHAEVAKLQRGLVRQLCREGLYGRAPFEVEEDEPAV